MSWTEFWMLLINGGILIIFRCWVESKWRRRDQENNKKMIQHIHELRPSKQKPQTCGNKFGVFNHVWIHYYFITFTIWRQTIYLRKICNV